MKVPTLTRAHLVIAVAIMFALGSAAGLSWAFAEQIAHSRELRVEELQLVRDLETAQAYYSELLELEQRVQTDAFVEDCARSSLVWVREGETAVVFVDPPPATDLPTQPSVEDVVVVLEEKPLWVEVWELIAGR